MYEEDNKKRHEFYLVYGLSATILIASFVMYSPFALILSAVVLLLAVIMLHSGHIINNLLIKRSHIIEISGNYRLGRNINSISRRYGNSYRSISMALLKPRATQANPAVFKELLEGLNEHFEFSIELEEIDKGKIIEGLRTKLRMKEIALTRSDQKSYDKLNAIKRQIDLINGEMANLAFGKSFQFDIKIKSICIADDQSEAEFCSSKDIEALANKFSAALGTDFQILSGEKLLTYSGV
ncbi:MAG: hypothetical protein M1569_04015 [Candidatus Marsarchaeota archaeon]|nr:hypothetical protein [Candidatus Marsarchaeota archaeon]MCL5413538.1 hypothetical protein [Candidatus Marsarchaeota archaeon]